MAADVAHLQSQMRGVAGFLDMSAEDIDVVADRLALRDPDISGVLKPCLSG